MSYEGAEVEMNWSGTFIFSCVVSVFSVISLVYLMYNYVYSPHQRYKEVKDTFVVKKFEEIEAEIVSIASGSNGCNVLLDYGDYRRNFESSEFYESVQHDKTVDVYLLTVENKYTGEQVEFINRSLTLENYDCAYLYDNYLK
mgnify:CR=1 FL=1